MQPWSESVTTQKRHHTDLRRVWPGTEWEGRGSCCQVIGWFCQTSPSPCRVTVGSLISLKSHANSRRLPLVGISNTHIYLCYTDSISSLENQMGCLATASFSLLTFCIPWAVGCPLVTFLKRQLSIVVKRMDSWKQNTWVLNPGSMTYWLWPLSLGNHFPS